MNSIKFLVAAAQHEIERQAELLRGGGTVAPETRGYDAKTHTTYRLRSKEDAHDYRFFPDPDLPPVVVSAEVVRRLGQTLPELPHAMRQRLTAAKGGEGVGERRYGLTAYDANVLIAEPAAVALFETVLEEDRAEDRANVASPLDAKTVANFIINDLFAAAAERALPFPDLPVTPLRVLQLLRMVADDTISART